MSDDKTEDPTEKKLKDAKDEGQHAKSTDVTAALVFGGVILLLSSTAESCVDHLRHIVDVMLTQGLAIKEDESFYPMIIELVKEWLLITLPFIIAAVLLGLISMAGQVGLNVTFKPLGPNFDKVNPASGLKNLMSMKSVIEVLKMVVKAGALISIVWTVIRDLLPLLVGAVYLPPEGIVAVGWAAIFKLFWGGLLLFIIIGPVDYGLQRWQFIKGQKMSKDDIKKEHKQSEGDPELKGQRKQLAKELANSDPQKAVAGAAVVITNPTHYAVALRYVPGQTALPVIVAKGMDESAARIRRFAEDHRVPIVGDPPLARALHKIPLDHPIPEELFEAVAAIVKWVLLVKEIESKPEGLPR